MTTTRVYVVDQVQDSINKETIQRAVEQERLKASEFINEQAQTVLNMAVRDHETDQELQASLKTSQILVNHAHAIRKGAHHR